MLSRFIFTCRRSWYYLDGDVAAATAIKTFENAKPEILALRQSADTIQKSLRRDALSLIEQLFQRASQ